ncbi:hypothetical protein ACLB6K_11190 [Microcystis aeruginosa FACHB-524]|uniref:Uncharacterized protein n=1 Tax=Microcystis viridis FACHB-1342 TaxID=2692900 RepID=A0ABR8GET2_MICVR|nr:MULTISPECIES: hypothetical protein [Microcystis]MBD2601819.1 hypothetical protein [Microcystis viridis FACHB-1342]MDB9386795.1 hypothetical protein [Microcystis aeruginosa CS-583]ROI12712.1 hypothetical protein ED562_01300 [Microcystis aeruginosa FACHB-524]
MPPQLLGIVVFTSLVECWTPLWGNSPQIEVIKPHSALINFHVLVLDRWKWDSRMERVARSQEAV